MKFDSSVFKSDCRIFEIRSDSDSLQDWNLEPIIAPTLATHQRSDPNGFFVIAAKQIMPDGSTRKAFRDVVMPERVIEMCYTLVDGCVFQTYPAPEEEIIPIVTIEGFGNYEDFYSRRHPEIGIEALREGLMAATLKWPIAMELGYILRDEGRPQEAIDAFSIALDSESSIAAAYLERSRLYKELGRNDAAEADLRLFDTVASPVERRLYGRA